MAALLLLPSAVALSGGGDFLAKGAVSLPPASNLILEPLAAYNTEPASMQSCLLASPMVTVTVYEREFAILDKGPMPVVARTSLEDGNASRIYRAASISLTPSGTYGGLGLYSPDGEWRASASSVAGIEPREESDLSDFDVAPGNQQEGPYDTAYVFRSITKGPHVLVNTTGATQFTGSGMLHIHGFDILIESEDGRHVIHAGVERPSPVSPQAIFRWALVEFHGGVLETESSHPWLLTAASTDASTPEGSIVFHALTGAMETRAARYVASDSPTEIEGRFDLHLAPSPSLGDILLQMELSGDLSSTTLAAQSIPASARLTSAFDGAVPLMLVTAVLASGAFFGGGMWYGHRRIVARRPPAAPAAAVAVAPLPAEAVASVERPFPFSVEDCSDAGALAASEEDWASAAKWFMRAHELAPTSARICADLAFALSQIGDVDEALQYYAEASRLSSDGEADFNAALAAIHAGRPVEEVEVLLERALARSPELVVPLDGDKDFHALQGRARYEAAVREAWRRLQKPRGGASLA